MSDFLMRLVERTLGLAPVVRPMIAPMFAQGPTIQNGYPSGSVRDNELQSGSDKMEVNHAQETLPAFSRYSLIPNLISQTHTSLADSSSITPGQPVCKTPGSPYIHYHSDSNPSSLEQAKDSTSHAMTGQNNLGISEPATKLVGPEDLLNSKHLEENILSLNEPVDKSGDKIFDTYRDAPKPKIDSGQLSNAALRDTAEVPDTQSAETSTLKPYASVDRFSDNTLPEQTPNNSQAPEHLFDTYRDAPKPKIDSGRLSSAALQDTAEAPDTQSAETSTLKPYAPIDRSAGILSQSMAAPKSFSSMPTIKVTIGRIEVRAITPSVIPAQGSCTPSPTLSLDDYLKKRNGGQR